MEAVYEFFFICVLLRLQSFILYYDNSRGLILPHANFCCFDYPFLPASISTRYGQFQKSKHFTHRFQKDVFFANFASWPFVESCPIPSQYRGHSYGSADYLEWRGLETHCALQVPTPPVYFIISNGCSKGASIICFSQSPRRICCWCDCLVFTSCYRGFVWFFSP